MVGPYTEQKEELWYHCDEDRGILLKSRRRRQRKVWVTHGVVVSRETQLAGTRVEVDGREVLVEATTVWDGQE